MKPDKKAYDELIIRGIHHALNAEKDALTPKERNRFKYQGFSEKELRAILEERHLKRQLERLRDFLKASASILALLLFVAAGIFGFFILFYYIIVEPLSRYVF